MPAPPCSCPAHPPESRTVKREAVPFVVGDDVESGSTRRPGPASGWPGAARGSRYNRGGVTSSPIVGSPPRRRPTRFQLMPTSPLCYGTWACDDVATSQPVVQMSLDRPDRGSRIAVGSGHMDRSVHYRTLTRNMPHPREGHPRSGAGRAAPIDGDVRGVRARPTQTPALRDRRPCVARCDSDM
jgi:hypothetical protein